jgi:cytochrome c oxidase cbb3-type subunit 3
MTKAAVLLAVALLPLYAGCEREQRRFSEIAPMSGRPQPVTSPALQPGKPGALPLEAQPTSLPAGDAGLYSANAWAISEGKRLYTWFNCVGCHSHGGGGMGPPLMDEYWTYGSEPENIYATIVHGRPNGMPAFGGKLADQQVWQLVAYVRSLGRLTRGDVRPGRNDDMAVRPSEQGMESQTPRSALPPQGERSR